ncbi:MAG: 1,4-alpha-glucan branching protein GlgB [Oscillospiraceae bacterium]|nr:1,4-alpha-glucan branching protein GlgB [Oscillospiraceae bacterium]
MNGTEKPPGADTLNAAVLRFAAGESCDAYRTFGSHPLGDGRWRFTVWAPRAAAVALTGDFSAWEPIPMTRLPSGAWTVETAGVTRGQIYKYAITGADGQTVEKSDPFAAHWETPPANGSRVWDIDGYVWGDAAFRARHSDGNHATEPISIYEVHLGSWRAAAPEARFPNYCETAAALAEYCRDMGYTHVELLPVTEYPYEPSWGYQVTGYFAPTSRYGTPQDFMYFVDTLHRAGIGVLMDWVPAHFPRDAHGLARFDGTPVYERDDPKMAAHPDWGTLIFDYEKPVVRSFLKSSAALFLDRYHIDGLRVDAVSSMLYLGFGRGDDFTRNRFGGDIDLGAVSLLQEINALAASRGAMMVAEESSAYPRVTGSASEGGLGFTFKWDMGFMHDTLDYMSLDPLWRRGSHQKLTFSMLYAFSERFILAFSHDEVVHGKRSMLDKMPGEYDQKFANLRVLYGYIFAHPGKKLTFMGSDFGQFIEWDYQKPLDWFLLDYPRHAEMQRWVRALNHFYTETPAFWELDCGWDGFDWLNVDDADRSSIAFLRRDRAGRQFVCACNFTPCAWQLQVALPGAGTLHRSLCSDEARFGGADAPDPGPIAAEPVPFRGQSHSALLALPSLSCTYYRFDPKEEHHEAESGTAAAPVSERT